MYGGLGQSLGSLIGGYLSKRYGISMTFQRCAMVDLVILGIFLVYQRVEDFNAIHSVTTAATTTATATSPSATVRGPLFPPVRLSLLDYLLGGGGSRSSAQPPRNVTADPSTGHLPSNDRSSSSR